MAKNLMQIYIGAAILAGGILASSCEKDMQPIGDFGNGTSPSSSEAQLMVKTVGNRSLDVTTRADESDPRNNFPVGYDFIKDKSRIRVCSVSRDPNTDFNVPNMDNAFVAKSSDNPGIPNGYHEYICQDKKDYEEYSIFNVYNGDTYKGEALIWDKLDANGNVIENSGNILRTTVGGGYYMYAAMFPYTYVPTGTIDGRSVNENQTYNPDDITDNGHYAANLLKNDIRYCYKMFGRDKFRDVIRLDFYHSLCMLVVNVEIPVYNEQDGTGFNFEDIKKANSMTLNNVFTCFKPNYTKDYDQNDFVEVSAYDVENREFTSVQMFHTPNFRNPSNITGPFNPEDAYWWGEDVVDHDGKPSNVVWTQFCAIIPPQRLTEENPSDNSYLDFEIGGRTYRCSLGGTPAIPLEQTYVTTLTLYIPRGETDPIIIGAHLNDWAKHRTPVIPLQ